MKLSHPVALLLSGLLFLIQGLAPVGVLAQDLRKTLSAEDHAGSPLRLESSDLFIDGKSRNATAKGDVSITYEGTVLKGDEIFLDLEEKTSFARGQVRLMHGEDILTCESLSFHWVDEVGVVEKGDLLFKDTGYHVRADRMEKTGPDTYLLDECAFTTCQCSSESARLPWEIESGHADVTLGGYAKFRKAKFRLLGIPVFYFPIGYLPVKTHRESGLLIPAISESEVNGWGFFIPYFWAIDASTDMTVALEAYTKRGVKPAVEFRYRPRKYTQGTWNVSGLYDLDIDDFRYGLKARHSQQLTESFYDTLDANFVSDDTYIEDFPADVGNTADWFLLSRGGFGYRGTNVHATAGATYANTVADWGGKEVAQQAPDFSVRMFPFPVLGRWVSVSLDSTATNYVNENGQERIRGQVYPEAILSVPVTPGLTLRGWGGVREVLSWGEMDMYDVPGAGSPELPANRILHRTLVQTGAGLDARLGRPFLTGSYRLSHIIEPSLEYQWIREVEGDAFPVEMDGLDTLMDRNWLTCRIRTSLWAAARGTAGAYVPAAELEIAQSLALQRDLQSSPTGELFSDVSLGFRVSPLPYLSLLGDLRIDPYTPSLRVLETGVAVSDEKGRGRVEVGYLRHDGYLVDPITLVELVDVYNENYLFPGIGNTIRARVVLKPLWWLSATWDAIYLIEEGGKQENFISVGYLSQCKCWSVAFHVHQTVRPDDVGFSVTFQLAGLGISPGDAAFGWQSRLFP